LSLTFNLQSISTYNSLQSTIEQQDILLDSYVSTINSLQGQIDVLYDQVSELQTIQESYASTINSLQSEITYLNYQLTYKEALNTALSQQIQNLNNQIEELQNETSSSSSSFSSGTIRTIYIDKIGTVTRVIDGDTFELSSGKYVRLADIDAPESYETGYTSSSNALSSWVLGKTVYLDVDDIYQTDIYGRLVCVVYVTYGSGYLNVNHQLVLDGYAETLDYSNEFDPSVWGTPGVIDTSNAEYETSTSSSSSSSSSSTSDGPYWASKNSDVYHKPTCYWAQQINPSNLIIFNSKAAAEAAGYRPCKVCKP